VTPKFPKIQYPKNWLGWIWEDLQWTFRVFYSSADRFYLGTGFSRAASLSYTSLLSLFPLTALLFGLLAFLAVSKENINGVREFVFRQFVPDSQVADSIIYYMQEFSAVISDPASSFNLTAFAVLIFTSILLINSIENTLNEIWQVFEPRSLTDRISIFSAILLLAPVLAVSAFYFTKLRLEPLIDSQQVMRLYTFLLPFLIDFMGFFALNYLVPKAPVKVSAAIIGAFTSALLFGLAKIGFAFYIERFASYDKLYGALASIPIFLVWLYLSWIVVLYGAEVAYQSQHLPRLGRIKRRSVLSAGDAQAVLALQTLIMISRAFERGDKMPNELEIAEMLGCSATVLKSAVSGLQTAQIIGHSDGRERNLILKKAPSAIKIKELCGFLFADGAQPIYGEEVGELFLSLNNPDKMDKDYTLQDLLDVQNKKAS
jgi:membrane protein